MVRATEFTEDLDDASLNLELSFARHQGRERHTSKVSSHRNLHVFNFLCPTVNGIQFLGELRELDFVKFVGVPEVELWMKVFDNWAKQVRELLVSLLISRHNSDRSLWHLDAALNAHLNVTSSARGFFLHTGPDIPTQVPFKERIAGFVELRIGDDWDSLWEWARHLDAIFIQLLLRY